MEWESDFDTTSLLGSVRHASSSSSSSTTASLSSSSIQREMKIQTNGSNWSGRAWMLGAFVAVVLISVLGSTHRIVSRLEETSEKQTSLNFAITTEGGRTVNSDYPWSMKLLEPYRQATLEAQFTDAEGDETYEWSVDGALLSGKRVSFTPTRTGWHDVQLTMTKTVKDAAKMRREAARAELRTEARVEGSTSSSASSVPSVTRYTEKIMSKYVRKELRTLDEEERERTLDAMHAVYKYSTAEGQSKFGSIKFKDIAYFVSKHLKGSASIECDSWHDGAGYLNHHVAFTLEFEQAIQAADPAVSLPYWDFTLDAHRQTYDDIDWKQSEVFRDDWFGAASPVRSDHAVDGTGRWALTPVMRVDKGSAEAIAEHPIHNPLGLLRSPWNLNPTPFITRTDTVAGFTAFNGELPSCKAYDKCFVSESISVMNECLNGITHGPTHIAVGGLWHKDLSGKLGGTDSLLEGASSYQLLLMSKNLWRQGFLKCPDTCDVDEKEEITCACTCPTSLHKGLSSYEVLSDKTGMLHWVAMIANDGALWWDEATQKYRVTGYEDAADGEAAVWDSLLHEVLCDPGYVGEMYTSASPYDPTFWLVHGTVDRLVHWRRIFASTAGTERSSENEGVGSDATAMLFDESWGYAHSAVAPSDTNLICDWSDVAKDSTTNLPTCDVGTCPGHNENDVLPFEGFIEGQKEGEMLTNREMYDFLSPFNEKLPYVYDNFRWAHCDKEGFTFGAQESKTAN